MVIKRNGQKVEFEKNKIREAVKKAWIEVKNGINNKGNSICDYVADEIETEYRELKDEISVEEIQNRVEDLLMDSGEKQVARAYIRYRYKRELVREPNEELYKMIGEKLNPIEPDRQNANVDGESFGGKVGSISDEVLKQYALYNCMSKKSRENHLNNEIYEHDLNSYATGSHNCITIPFDDLLATGFTTRQTDVRPAQSVSTAFQLVAVIFQLQSLMQFGGVAASHLDWTMIPYVRKSFGKHYLTGMKYIRRMSDEWLETNEKDIKHDNPTITDGEYYLLDSNVYQYAMDMTEKEVYQAVEGMYHNLNTLQSRSGNQLPFTSINYGTCTLPEGRMITKALLDTSIKGIGKLHRTSIFPCGIFQCMKGVNQKEGEPNYDLFKLALKSTAQRLYPNYANVDWSGNFGYDKNDPRTYFATINKTVA